MTDHSNNSKYLDSIFNPISDGIRNWYQVTGGGVGTMKIDFFCKNFNKNAKEILSLGFWVTKIKTNTVVILYAYTSYWMVH